MTFKDRWNSFLHGRFVDAPSEDSLRSELAEVVDELVKARHDIEHMRVDQHSQYLKLLAERRLNTAAARTIERLQDELMCARLELYANQGDAK